MPSTQPSRKRPRGNRRLQRGAAPFAEGLFLALFWVVGLALLLVFGMALWIGKGAKGKLIGFIVACGICSPILWPLAQTAFEDVRDDRLKTDVIPICQRELQETPGPFLIDGFVDETGGLRSKHIQYFLVDAGLAFVEVKLSDDGKLTGPEDYPWTVSQRGGYARLQLEAQGQGNCYVPSHRKVEDFFTSMAPVRPGTCLVVTFSDRPSARHQVALDSRSSTSTRSRWVLRNLSTGTEVAGFTDASKALSPHPPWLDVNDSDCRPNGTSGYSTLMRRVQASPEARARTRQHVLDRGAVAVVGLPATIAELEAQRKANSFPTLRSLDGPYAGDSAEVLDRRPWKDAYALAFEGRTLWAGQLAPLSPWTDTATLRFVPERFELAEDALLVHGIFGHSVGVENRKPWTVKIPRVELARLFAGALPP